MTINYNKQCSEDGCFGPVYSRGWCCNHYERARLPDGSIGETTFDISHECLICNEPTKTFKRFCKLCIEKIPRADRLKLYKKWHYETNKDSYVEARTKPTFEVSRQYNLKYNYNLKKMDLTRIREIQNNKCAICEKPEIEDAIGVSRLHIDHDHSTGNVRGLLCMSCNVGIGHLKDDPKILRKAIQYLERASNGKTDGID